MFPGGFVLLFFALLSLSLLFSSQSKKLDTKEEQEKYALERHEKGWCRPCKKFFAKNAECVAHKKGQPCLYCHHEDHRADMPSRLPSRQVRRRTRG